MTQAERDRLVTLKKAKKRLITQREAAEELGVTVRQVKRLLKALKKRGDKAVVHGLRGRPSKRKIAAGTQREAMEILGSEVYRGFGPTLAAEYLAKKHAIQVSRETVRQWMRGAGLWKGRRPGWKEYTCGGRAAAAAASWCSGTPANTTGWKAGENGFT